MDSRISITLTIISAVILLTDYFIQIAVVPVSFNRHMAPITPFQYINLKNIKKNLD